MEAGASAEVELAEPDAMARMAGLADLALVAEGEGKEDRIACLGDRDVLADFLDIASAWFTASVLTFWELRKLDEVGSGNNAPSCPLTEG